MLASPRSHGRRPLILALVGALWLLIGGSVLLSDSAIDPADAILYEALPVPLRAGLWIGTGLVAIAAARSRGRQNVGFAAVAIMPAERAVSHLWSWSMSLIPGEPPGTTWEGIGMGLTWSIGVALILVVAGWDEDSGPTESGRP